MRYLRSFKENCQILILSISKDNNSEFVEPSWTDVYNGVETTITLSDVDSYLDSIGSPVIEIPTNEIASLSIHKDKKDAKTLDRVNASDTSFPIIISKDLDGKYNRILDGHHRLQKSINNNVPTIKARVLDLNEASDLYKFMFI